MKNRDRERVPAIVRFQRREIDRLTELVGVQDRAIQAFQRGFGVVVDGACSRCQDRRCAACAVSRTVRFFRGAAVLARSAAGPILASSSQPDAPTPDAAGIIDRRADREDPPVRLRESAPR